MTQSDLFIYPHPDRLFHTGTGNNTQLQSQSRIFTLACSMLSHFTFRKVKNKDVYTTADRRHCCSDAMKPFFFISARPICQSVFTVDVKRDTPFKLS